MMVWDGGRKIGKTFFSMPITRVVIHIDDLGGIISMFLTSY
jgi:hypothetical protein